jgi:hypothetical protein
MADDRSWLRDGRPPPDDLLRAHRDHADEAARRYDDELDAREGEAEVYDGVMHLTQDHLPERTIIGEPQRIPEHFDRMSDREWGQFVDRQARTLAELEAAQAGQAHPERAALHSRVMALGDETGLSYEDALHRVLDREERLP